MKKFALLTGGGTILLVVLLTLCLMHDGLGWSVSCSTWWDDVVYRPCNSPSAYNSITQTATLSITVGAGYNCQGRVAYAKTTGEQQVASATCQGDANCCAYAHWTALQGVSYYVNCNNGSRVEDCSAWANIKSGSYLCQQSSPQP